MKYGLMPKLMWGFYRRSFKKELARTLSEVDPKSVMKEAHKKYKGILLDVTEFDKGDRFLINILSCAMLSSVLLSLKNHYSVEKIRLYYRNAMCQNLITKIASKGGKSYSPKGREKLKEQAKRSERNVNPYSWKFSVTDGKTLNQYTAYFYTCGICCLMKKLNLQEYIPAMCALDYDMAKLNHTVFTREQTLATGGKWCDCHYDHEGKRK